MYLHLPLPPHHLFFIASIASASREMETQDNIEDTLNRRSETEQENI